MNNVVLNGGEVVYFALKVDGTVIGEMFTDRVSAESSRTQMLTESDQPGMVITVVQVTTTGQEILFG